jgi:hypothetical protein
MSKVATDIYVELVSQANAIFQKKYPAMFTFSATGMPASGVAKTEDDLTVWKFNGTDKNTFAELKYSNGAFGEPFPAKETMGLEYRPLPEGIVTLSQAITILNKNGYTGGFSSVSMGTPVTFEPQPMYWFCVNGHTQGVSARTGDFFPDLFTCSGAEFRFPAK